jgi:ribosome biogenesis protein ERB1
MPNPSDLKPFPSKISIEYKGHNESKIRSISVSPCGKYLASGDEAGNLILWDVQTGRIRQRYTFEGIIDCVRFNPNKNVLVLAVVTLKRVYILIPQKLYSKNDKKKTEELIREFKRGYVPIVDSTSNKKPTCKWDFIDESKEEYLQKDVRVILE